MRVGVIGLGSIGTRHTKNLIALGHSVTGYDNAMRGLWLEDETGWAQSFDEFLDTQPQAVLICTPASTHAAVARRLLDAGYRSALFVEKPLALSVAEAAIFAAWPHPTTMVGYNLRFHDVVVRMRQAVPQASRGGFMVECDMTSWPGASYGSPMLELSHEIDLALHFGAPAEIESVEVNDSAIELNFVGSWCVQIDGASKRYVRSWDVGGRGRGFMWHFDSPEELGNQMYVDEIAHFLDCAARGVPTETPFADGIRVLDVIAQAEALARQAATR